MADHGAAVKIAVATRAKVAAFADTMRREIVAKVPSVLFCMTTKRYALLSQEGRLRS